MVTALRAAGADTVTAIHTGQAMYGMKGKSSGPQPSLIEAYGTAVHQHISRRNLNVRGLDAFDLRTAKANGEPWNFCKRKDRQEARKIIERKRPMWIIGAPPCTSFSIWNHAMNHKKKDPQRVREQLKEGRLHLQFACSLYRRSATTVCTVGSLAMAFAASSFQDMAVAGCSCTKYRPHATCRLYNEQAN